MAGMLQVPRSRGALSGTLLLLLGIWGGLIAFIGPYFHYAYTPDQAWAYTTGRLWLEIIPGAAAFLGGLMVLASRNRAVAGFGAWIAALAGLWFVVGGFLSTLWTASGTSAAGTPVGGTLARAVEQAGFFAGLGAVIVFLAAFALGRFAVGGGRVPAHRAGEPVPVPEQAGPPPGDQAPPPPGDHAAPSSGDRAATS